MENDRRREARLDAKLFAELETTDGSPLGRAVVTDVSLHGIAVHSEAELSQNQTIRCHLEIPIELKATVRAAAEESVTVRRYGLKFTGLSLIEKFLLRRLLRGSRHTRKVGL